MKKLLSILFILFSCPIIFAQYTISGYLKDGETGESMIGATIIVDGTSNGTVSNVYGFFSLKVDTSDVTIVYSFVGYSPIKKTYSLTGDVREDLELAPALLDAVEITATKSEKIQETTQMSTIDIPIDQIKKLPAILGEVDVIRALQLLPGVQSGSEASSGMYVRGGGPDQNLILLDGTPVYNASHLFGFFSVFNADAIKKVELVKGGYPARYGGRLSSVLDIRLKDGNMKKYKASGNIGIISSKVTFEGPIIKNKASFIAAGRRTYVDALYRPIMAYNQRKIDPNTRTSVVLYFYDLNAKLNWKINDKNRVYFSAYSGEDKFAFNDKYSFESAADQEAYSSNSSAGLDWGNLTSAFRWNKEWNKKLFSNLTLTYSNYEFNIGVEEQSTSTIRDTISNDLLAFGYSSGIQDYAFNYDFDFITNNNHFIKFGMNTIRHTFNTGALAFSLQNSDAQLDTTLTVGRDPLLAYEYSTYIEDDWKINALLKINIGLHASAFNVGNTIYKSLQPRLAARLLLSEQMSLKGSYAMMQQYVHLLTNSNIGLPTDLWVPSTESTIPERSQQVALGLARTINDTYEVSVEGYYRTMDNVIAYQDGANFIDPTNTWEDKIEPGRAWAYGAELFVQKKVGEFTGWIGYTLAWTNRQFPNINFGRTFPYRYDRRHDVSIVGNYKINDLWAVAATWVYGTGNAATLGFFTFNVPNESFYSDFTSSTQINHFGSRNNFRMEAYHRLDIGFTRSKQRKWGRSEWNFGAYNVYNRANPFYYRFATERDSRGREERVLKRVSLFPIIPSVSWSFFFE